MRPLCALALSTLIAGCPSPSDRPPSGCETLDASCGSLTVPPAGGGGRRDGAADRDVAIGDATTTVNGQVSLSQSIPLIVGTTSTRPAAGWTVQSLVMPASGAVSTTTNDMGHFQLAGVPLVDGLFLLRAMPPPGVSAMGAIAESTPSMGTLEMLTVDVAVLQSSAAGAGLTASPALGHVIMQLTGSSSAISGVQGAMPGTSAQVVYDDSSGRLNASVDRTGSLGTLVFFNVDAPAAGRHVRVVLSRAGTTMATLEYDLFVMPGHVTWVGSPPP